MGDKNLLGVATVENPRSFDKLEKALTGQKDTDLLIMSNLDDETLLSFCLANRSANLLCKDESFWRNRFINKYGVPPFTVSNWRRVYLKTVSYLNPDLKKNPWIFPSSLALYNAVKFKDYELFDIILFIKKIEIDEENIAYILKGAIDSKDLNNVKFIIGKIPRDVTKYLLPSHFPYYSDMSEEIKDYINSIIPHLI